MKFIIFAYRIYRNAFSARLEQLFVSRVQGGASVTQLLRVNDREALIAIQSAPRPPPARAAARAAAAWRTRHKHIVVS